MPSRQLASFVRRSKLKRRRRRTAAPSSFASQARADDIQGLGNRQDPGARIHSALHDVLEEIRRAPVRSGSSADVMRGKYEPPPSPTILPNGFFDERWLLSTLLEKERLQQIQVGRSHIERLPSASTASEIFPCSPLCIRTRTAYRIGKRPESGSGNKPVEGALVVDY